MRRTITDIILTMLGIASISCLISLMALFIGGGQVGSDLRGLMYFQAGLTPLAMGVTIFSVYPFVSSQGWANGAQAIWRVIPQWLVFIFLLLNSLVLLGEIAYAIVMRATDDVVYWHEHIPFVCLLVCSSAYLALYARANSYPGSPPAMSGRWM